jgi:predicted membrane protein
MINCLYIIIDFICILLKILSIISAIVATIFLFVDPNSIVMIYSLKIAIVSFIWLVIIDIY